MFTPQFDYWFGFGSNLLQYLTALPTVAAAIFSAAMFYKTRAEQRRLDEEIRVTLKLRDDDRSVELPVHLSRRELTRAELLGRLGMMPMRNRGSRFALDFLGTLDFLAELRKVQQGSGEQELIIPCSSVEIDQFAL